MKQEKVKEREKGVMGGRLPEQKERSGEVIKISPDRYAAAVPVA